jgi:hypothetical protein
MAENTTDEGPGTGRYAAYDKDLERFVGGVHDAKDKAAKAAKDRGVKRAEIREV